jgi:hypothetical protein
MSVMILNIGEKKSAILVENMEKVGVGCFKKSVIFAAIRGQIKN